LPVSHQATATNSPSLTSSLTVVIVGPDDGRRTAITSALLTAEEEPDGHHPERMHVPEFRPGVLLLSGGFRRAHAKLANGSREFRDRPPAPKQASQPAHYFCASAAGAGGAVCAAWRAAFSSRLRLWCRTMSGQNSITSDPTIPSADTVKPSSMVLPTVRCEAG
jgi:hypothetical protein